MVSISGVSWSASSTARKLSPGTVKMRSQPWILSWSTRIWPPVRLVMGGALAAGREDVEWARSCARSHRRSDDGHQDRRSFQMEIARFEVGDFDQCFPVHNGNDPLGPGDEAVLLQLHQRPVDVD